MSKCDVCKKELKEGLIGKIRGAYVWINKKKAVVCSDCQQKHGMDKMKKLVK
ncbi:MAG: hypothetical protein PHT91_03200 [Candidatus Nanoarchaeia archaeon]|nr:hypothetical protein [Candidatus Nanoarchaeia archaeon]MDD5054318.1 hypothetical protein [Candidatus Nanoarchaeia archaeon]MDD5499855.1 hypothetical protein [Candidatus Nanoarchaeia archaeon]